MRKIPSIVDFEDFLKKLEHLPLQQEVREPNFFGVSGAELAKWIHQNAFSD